MIVYSMMGGSRAEDLKQMQDLKKLQLLSRDMLISTIQIQDKALEGKEKRLEAQAEYIGWLLDKMDEFGCKPTAYEIQKLTEGMGR